MPDVISNVENATHYVAPNGRQSNIHTSMDSLFSDDFGGAAIDLTQWDVLDGGLAANVSLGNHVLAQGKIGSGIVGIAYSVAASGLTVSMGTTLGAELWFLSKPVFAGKEDILVILSRSQALAANSAFIGLVEVDPATLVPLLNPNFAADGNGSMEFTNRGGCEFGLTATATAYQAEAIGDSSSAKATGGVGNNNFVALTTTQEFLIEIDSRDITVSGALVDSTNAKAGASRVSTQCPNDKRLYKLLMRFRNVGAPGSNTNFVIQRGLVVDNYEQRVQISTAEGDAIGSKALAVNVVANPTFSAFSPMPNTAAGASQKHKLTSAATTNATSVKASTGILCGGSLRNRAASERYFKLYQKATAPVVGTDTPILTIGIPAGGAITLGDVFGFAGLLMSTGVAYAITGAYADNDTTAVAAGDVDVNLIYG